MTETSVYDDVADRQVVFMTLYEICFPTVARFIAKRGGTLDEAADVFQDALLVYYEKTREQSFRVMQDNKGYIFGIARHLWLKRYRENSRHLSLDELMAGYTHEPEN